MSPRSEGCTKAHSGFPLSPLRLLGCHATLASVLMQKQCQRQKVLLCTLASAPDGSLVLVNLQIFTSFEL